MKYEGQGGGGSEQAVKGRGSRLECRRRRVRTEREMGRDTEIDRKRERGEGLSDGVREGRMEEGKVRVGESQGKERLEERGEAYWLGDGELRRGERETKKEKVRGRKEGKE